MRMVSVRGAEPELTHSQYPIPSEVGEYSIFSLFPPALAIISHFHKEFAFSVVVVADAVMHWENASVIRVYINGMAHGTRNEATIRVASVAAAFYFR